MSPKSKSFSVKLFCSYSHKDDEYKIEFQKSLSHLRQTNRLNDWSDSNILPGHGITSSIFDAMEGANILVFLMSRNFIASKACMEEWETGKRLAKTGRPIFRIPIILEDCPWLDLLENDGDDVKALPYDGTPVCTYHDQSKPWMEIYHGIKEIINALAENFSPKPNFLEQIQQTAFIGKEKLLLEEIFVFPHLSCYTSKQDGAKFSETIITKESELLNKRFALVHGDDMSGKTALGRYLFLSLVKQHASVLYIDLATLSVGPNEKKIQDAYEKEFEGDYHLWNQDENKTLILDNLTAERRLVEFIVLAKERFSNVFVTLPSNVFKSYFSDDDRFAKFHEIEILALTHSKQERLIRKRLSLIEDSNQVTDGKVDQVENRVNSIIISNKIVPRYPFYVLSILQTYESFMPSTLSITSFGHCYYVLIISRFIKAGISQVDSDINACFNFLEKISYATYKGLIKDDDASSLNFSQFVEEYQDAYFIKTSIINRLKDNNYGIISQRGIFRARYMYYFFLGRHFARNQMDCKDDLEYICKQSHVSPNDLIVLFVIHHTNDNAVIEEIMLRTMCTLEHVGPAELNDEESSRFFDILTSVPNSILRNDSIQTQRDEVRERRDQEESRGYFVENRKLHEKTDRANEVYRVLTNMQILGQILRNRHGALKKSEIGDIVITIADGGLRLVNCMLRDEGEIKKRAALLSKRYPKYDERKLRKALSGVSFVWTIGNLAAIVHAINVPEIRDAVVDVVRKMGTPAYDLIGYFNSLDGEEQLSNRTVKELSQILKKHNNLFISSVVSLKTQNYMNTHASPVSIEQKICSLVGVQYVPRLKRTK